MRRGEQRQRRIALWVIVAAYILMYPVSLTLVLFVSGTMVTRGLFLICGILTPSIMSLLGVWAILGSGPWWWRLIWVISGVLYCWIMLSLAVLLPMFGTSVFRSEVMKIVLPQYIFITVPFFVFVLGVTGVLFALQRLGIRLVLLDNLSREQSSRPFQFSLRSLFLFGVIIALLLGASRASRLYDAEESWHSAFLVNSFLWAILVPVAAVWAVFSVGLPWVLTGAVMFITICLAVVTGSPDSGMDYLVAIVFSALKVLGIIVPLLVVRSYGYRFVRWPERHPDAEQAS